jgi:hypothetical protein
MQYMLVLYEDHAAYDSEQAWADIIKAHMAYGEALAKAGVIRGGEGLAGPEAARTFRKRGGNTTVHDGPHAEMQEQLGGFYIIEVETMEQALEWAAKVPFIADGSVEIRPCIEGPSDE